MESLRNHPNQYRGVLLIVLPFFINPKIKHMRRTVWNYIRVKFLPGTDLRGKRNGMSRPTRIYEISIFETDEKTNKEKFIGKEYAPSGIKYTSKRIDPTTFVTTWERTGKTPNPKPLKHYSDQSLKKLGYSVSEVRTIRTRCFSARDIKLVCKRLGIKSTYSKKGERLTSASDQAKALLNEYNGKKYLIPGYLK